MFVITAIALVGLVVFAITAIGHFDLSNLTGIAPTDDAGSSSFLPFGYLGIWSAIPFAIWFFLAIEGVSLAAEETADPERNVPRGIIAAISVLLVTCATVLLLNTAAEVPVRCRRRAILSSRPSGIRRWPTWSATSG